jgi:Phospholipase_D-nuclease N-terminal
MLGEYWRGGFFFIVGLVLAIWSVIHIVQSERTPLAKSLWCVLVLFLPYVGFVLWLLFGPRAKKTA